MIFCDALCVYRQDNATCGLINDGLEVRLNGWGQCNQRVEPVGAPVQCSGYTNHVRCQHEATERCEAPDLSDTTQPCNEPVCHEHRWVGLRDRKTYCYRCWILWNPDGNVMATEDYEE